MKPQSQSLIQKLETLSSEHREAVNDFIDFLLMREQQQNETLAISRLSEASLAQIWDNEEDAVHDQL